MAIDFNIETIEPVHFDAETEEPVRFNSIETFPWYAITGKPSTFPPSEHNHDDRYYTEEEVDSQIEDVREIAAGKNANIVVNLSSNPSFNSQNETITATSIVDIEGNTISADQLKKGDNVYVTDTAVPDRWVASLSTVGNVTTATFYILETAKVPVTDVQDVGGVSVVANGIASISGKADVNHTHDDRYYTENECNNKFVTLDTEQELSAKKVFGYTEPKSYGGQETIVKILSTRASSDMATSMWAGRMIVGTEDKTFLMGVYKGESSPMCGLGAHKWTSARRQVGASWDDVYIQPDGDKSVYLGGYNWTINGGWLMVQNNSSGSSGSNHVFINVGTMSAPSWKVVPFIDDASTASNATWSAQKLNTAIGNIEATLQAIRGV